MANRKSWAIRPSLWAQGGERKGYRYLYAEMLSLRSYDKLGGRTRFGQPKRVRVKVLRCETYVSY